MSIPRGQCRIHYFSHRGLRFNAAQTVWLNRFVFLFFLITDRVDETPSGKYCFSSDPEVSNKRRTTTFTIPRVSPETPVEGIRFGHVSRSKQ